MQQQKYKYIYNDKEISKEEFDKLAGDSYKHFVDGKVYHIPFSIVSQFFDGDFKSKRVINDHVKSILEESKGLSTRHKANTPMTFMDEVIGEPTFPHVPTRCKIFAYKPEESVSPLTSEIVDLQSSADAIKNTVKVFNYLGDDDVSNKYRTDITSPHKVRDLDEELDKWEEKLSGKKETEVEQKKAYKETEGKLFYELDWNFITQMAERMASNKKEGKYELFNWKLPMTPKGIEDLKQATMRHLLEVMNGNYEDDGRAFGHLEAISDNMMMLNYQFKQK